MTLDRDVSRPRGVRAARTTRSTCCSVCRVRGQTQPRQRNAQDLECGSADALVTAVPVASRYASTSRAPATEPAPVGRPTGLAPNSRAVESPSTQAAKSATPVTRRPWRPSPGPGRRSRRTLRPPALLRRSGGWSDPKDEQYVQVGGHRPRIGRRQRCDAVLKGLLDAGPRIGRDKALQTVVDLLGRRGWREAESLALGRMGLSDVPRPGTDPSCLRPRAT